MFLLKSEHNCPGKNARQMRVVLMMFQIQGH